MALTLSSTFVQQSTDSLTITSASRSTSVNDVVVVRYISEDNSRAGTLSIANTGAALTWNLIAQTNTANDCKASAWWAKVATAGNITVTVTSSGLTKSALGLDVYTGAHATTPIPAGNVFSGVSGTDISQAITPTSTGSMMAMVAGDWNATNSFAAIANNTLEQTYHQAGIYTATFIRPTTQPLGAGAFTIGETDTSGLIAWIAYEVQAAAEAPVTNIAKNALPQKRRLGRRAYEFSQFFDSTFNVQGAFDKDIALFPAAGGNTGSIASINQSDRSSLTGIQSASGLVTSRNQSDRSQLNGVQAASGAIQSLNQSDSSQLSGGQAATGILSSRNTNDLSSLTGQAIIGGSVSSRNNNDSSSLSGVQPASGAISSRNSNDQSNLVGTQTASGLISSTNNNDSSLIQGTSGSTTTGAVLSLNNNDLSALTSAQTATGSIQSRNNVDISSLSGTQAATGIIQALNKNDTSFISGFQPVNCIVNSFNNNDLSNLTAFSGTGSIGGIQSFNNPDISFLILGIEISVNIGGGVSFHRKSYSHKDIRDSVEKQRNQRPKLTLKKPKEQEKQTNAKQVEQEQKNTVIRYKNSRSIDRYEQHYEQMLLNYLERVELQLEEDAIIRIIAELL